MSMMTSFGDSRIRLHEIEDPYSERTYICKFELYQNQKLGFVPVKVV